MHRFRDTPTPYMKLFYTSLSFAPKYATMMLAIEALQLWQVCVRREVGMWRGGGVRREVCRKGGVWEGRCVGREVCEKGGV